MALNLKDLNSAQREAVTEIEGPCMIIAGAGSGKTRVLTYKLAYLIERGVSPYEILSLTFTNKAANEMKERVTNLTGLDANRIWMGTFHSIFARLLRFEADRIGFTRSYSIYDTNDSLNLVKRVMTELEISTESFNPAAIHGAISKLKNKLILPSEYSIKAYNAFEKKVAEVYHEYQRLLLKSNAMDFDDLLIKPLELFSRYPEILIKYMKRFKFILVDEYQDTNRAQYQLVKMLSQMYENISVVGDDAQSIYKWRGAEIQNIFDFETDFPHRKIFRLEQNYRSTGSILALAGDVIKKNRRQIEKELWTDNKKGDKVKIIETLTDKDEANKIARQIRDEIKNKKLKFSDFAILYRTNAQSRTLEESLWNSGIPYIIVGGTRFYQRKEIKDIICYLKIIVNPNDDEATLRVLGLTDGIGKTSIEKLVLIARDTGRSIYDVIYTSETNPEIKTALKKNLREIISIIEKYKTLKNEIRLSELVNGVIDEIGIISRYKSENTNEAEERLNNIEELKSAVAEFSDNTEEPTLENFLEQISLVADIDEFDSRKNAVTLMTIHSSKGLEFPVVFITGLEENLFPVSGSIANEEDMEEERRLFYVAITRAQKKLFISYSNQRYRFGVQSYQVKSRFLKEISDKVLKENVEIEKISLKDLVPVRQKKSGISYEYDNTAIKYNGYSKSLPEFEDDKFSDIKKGVKINHESFGSGQVLAVTGKGIDKKAEIYFKDLGVIKKIILKYAKMRVIQNN